MSDVLDELLRSASVCPTDPETAAMAATIFLARWAIVIAPLCLAALWILGRAADRRAAVSAAASTLFALVLAFGISSIWMRPRPFVTSHLHNVLQHVPDGSFPSDHSTLLFALGFGLLRPKSVFANRTGFLAIAFGAVVGGARVCLAAHHATDIIGAAAVAAVPIAIMTTRSARALCDRLTGWGEHMFSWSVTRDHRTDR